MWEVSSCAAGVHPNAAGVLGPIVCSRMSRPISPGIAAPIFSHFAKPRRNTANSPPQEYPAQGRKGAFEWFCGLFLLGVPRFRRFSPDRPAGHPSDMSACGREEPDWLHSPPTNLNKFGEHLALEPLADLVGDEFSSPPSTARTCLRGLGVIFFTAFIPRPHGSWLGPVHV